MAWVKKSTGANDEFLLATETVALGKTTTAVRYSSEIDFIPPGSDFIIMANTSATNTSGSCHLRMYVAHTSGGTYGLLNQNIPNSTATRALDSALRVYNWDASLKGTAPYMKLAIYHTAAESSSKTIGLAILVRKQGIKKYELS